jgi:NAD(P)-dependent dehydrogenase (short-subunit alcohol dehydrogenase family)
LYHVDAPATQEDHVIDLEQSSAVVFGGASGLGRATAALLASRGARVVVADFNADAAAHTADEIGGEAVTADVTAAEDVGRAIAAAGALAPLRVSVCCAGLGTPAKILGRDAEPLDLEAFAQIVNVNLIGTFNALRLAAAAMTANEPGEDGDRGIIINTASVAAYDGQIGQPAYASSKAGVVGLTLPAARELARYGIRVMTIAPGIFDTPMLAALPDEARASLGASIPFPARLGKPDEYAQLVVHFVENPVINGETVRLDGAIRMAPR